MTAYVQYLPQPFFLQVGVKYLTGVWEIGSLMHFCEKFDFIILASKQKVFLLIPIIAIIVSWKMLHLNSLMFGRNQHCIGQCCQICYKYLDTLQCNQYAKCYEKFFSNIVNANRCCKIVGKKISSTSFWQIMIFCAVLGLILAVHCFCDTQLLFVKSSPLAIKREFVSNSDSKS